jgi:hypothetical protein
MANNGVGSLGNVRKKMTYTHELISTSYHEAGHAVYALLYFMRIPLVYVFENKKNKRIEGFCHCETFKDLKKIKNSDLYKCQLRHEICFQYAGLTSEKYHFKTISGSNKFPMFLREGSSDDTFEATALIKKYDDVPPGRKRYAYKKKLIKETLVDLEKHWDAVTLVAHALFQKKKLNYEDLKKLLTRKTANKEFWKEQFKNINYIFDNIGTIDEKYVKSILSA